MFLPLFRQSNSVSTYYGQQRIIRRVEGFVILILIIGYFLLFQAFAHAREPIEDQNPPPQEKGLEVWEVARPVKVMITDYARQANVNPALALKIAECESGFDPKVKNKGSSARGLFQILKGPQAEVETKTGTKYDVFDPEHNTQMAMWLFKKYGNSPWLESKNCWR